MKLSWLICVVFLAVCMICEVVGDYSEPLLPSKELRNRVHRTMRMNMRVGKRYGDEYDEEVPKRGLRLTIRTGKRSDPQLSANTQHTLDTFLPLDTVDIQEPQGKRNYNSLEQVRFYAEPQRESEGNILEDAIVAPKRQLRKTLRTGKRNTLSTLDTPSEQFDTYSDDRPSEDFLLSPDYKRSTPQFLLNPRVGKNDKTWTVALSKRGDPKTADMWFGPRIGRSPIDQLEELPWSYVIFNNGNRLAPVLKSNELDEQSKDNGSD